MSAPAKEALARIRQLLDEIKQQYVGAPIDTEAANAYACAVHESQQKASEAIAMVEAILSSGDGEEIERQKREINLRLCIAQMLDAIDLGSVDSETIEGRHGEQPHKFHEEWAHHARQLIGDSKPEGGAKG